MFFKLRSTLEKICFHFIHANPTILFENNITLGIFIKILMNLILISIIEHKCAYFNIEFNKKKKKTYTTSDLIKILSSHITKLRLHCNKFYISNSYISISEITYLLILNKENQWTLAIDLNVYSKNQQFRLYDCPKRGQNNFLYQSTLHQLQDSFKTSYNTILKKSLITYNIDNSNLPIIRFDNNQFIIKENDIQTTPLSSFNNENILKMLNQYYALYSDLQKNKKIICHTEQLKSQGPEQLYDRIPCKKKGKK